MNEGIHLDLDTWIVPGQIRVLIIIIIIEGLSLLQSIPPTTADKQTQAQKRRGSRSRKLLGAKAKRSMYYVSLIIVYRIG